MENLVGKSLDELREVTSNLCDALGQAAKLESQPDSKAELKEAEGLADECACAIMRAIDND